MKHAVLTPPELYIFDFGRGFGMDTHSSEAVARTLSDLRKAQGSALIVGGMAVIHYGYRRYTHDADILYANADEFDLLRRLKKDFRTVLKAKSGWHHLEHRKTKVRLELIPEGGVGTYGFIPGPKTVGGKEGLISLLGLVWLKLVAGRGKDDADLLELAKQQWNEMSALVERLPPELRDRYSELLAKAKREFENDPGRLPDDLADARDKAEESAATYGRKKRVRRKPVAKRGG